MTDLPDADTRALIAELEAAATAERPPRPSGTSDLLSRAAAALSAYAQPDSGLDELEMYIIDPDGDMGAARGATMTAEERLAEQYERAMAVIPILITRLRVARISRDRYRFDAENLVEQVETSYAAGRADGESALRNALLARVKDEGPEEGMLIIDQHALSVFSATDT